MAEKKDWFESIDQIFLAWANKATKKFNWLTGKDNFYLARLICRFNFLFSTLGFHLIRFFFFYQNDFFALGIMVVFITLFTRKIVEEIVAIEKIKEKERINGVKFLEIDLFLSHNRQRAMKFTFGYLFMASVLFCFPGTIFLVFLNWSFYIFFEGLIYYLLSVENPPYAKSQVFNLVKNLFSVSQLKPVPVNG